jgi:hypothetical protein
LDSLCVPLNQVAGKNKSKQHSDGKAQGKPGETATFLPNGDRNVKSVTHRWEIECHKKGEQPLPVINLKIKVDLSSTGGRGQRARL